MLPTQHDFAPILADRPILVRIPIPATTIPPPQREVSPMRTLPTLVMVCFSVGLAGTLSAQQSSGLFAGTPAAISVASGGFQVPLRPHEIHVKTAGFHHGQVGEWQPSGNGAPDFRLEAVFQMHGVPAGAFPDVDALSLGQDWVLADDSNGRIDVPPGQWGAVTFSVDRSTRGALGSVIRSESNRTDGAAGDVFSYVLPGSALPIVGVTERAHDSSEINLDPGDGQKEIDAVDHFIPYYTLPAQNRLMPAVPSIYFSVSDATKHLVPVAWWGRTLPSGATILCTTLTPSAGWSQPVVYRDYARIGLAVSEDLDALGLDLDNGRMLFSTKTGSRDPILFQDVKVDLSTIETYADQNGGPVSADIGLLENDDVDAICSMDPAVRARPLGGRNATWHAIGTPLATPAPPAVVLTASAHRRAVGANDVFRTFAVGWPPNTGAGPGFAGLFLEIPNVPPGFALAGFNRNPLDSFAGNPQCFDLVVPPVLALTGSDLYLHWYAIDSGLTELVRGHKLVIHL